MCQQKGAQPEQNHLHGGVQRCSNHQKACIFIRPKGPLHLYPGIVEEQEPQKQLGRVGESEMLRNQAVVLMVYGEVRVNLQVDECFQLKQRNEDRADGEGDQDAFG